VRQLMLNGIDACWQPEEIKAQWRQDWAREFDLLRQMLAQEPRIDTAHHIPYHRRYKV
ncbi:adenosine deaminase, partial [Salmonella enterica]|nr:adenosine deaminase [Salmonella enterica]